MIDYKEKRRRIIRASITISIFAIYVGVILYLYIGLGFADLLKDTEQLKEVIESTKYPKLLFVLINFIQTTLLPIPNFFTIIVGTYIFDPITTTILTFIGVFTGSMINFAIGKFLGKKAVCWIVGKETVEKYLDSFKGREKFVISSMLLLPGFPDDIICIIAGLTKMTWKYFIISVLLFRPLPLIINVYFGTIIPLYGWGLVVWAVIIILYVLLGRYIALNWKIVDKSKTLS